MAKRPALATLECVEVASFVGSTSLSADCRYNLLMNHFKPGANFSFPKSNSTGRSFQYRWLTVSLACIQPAEEWQLLSSLSYLRLFWVPWLRSRCPCQLSFAFTKALELLRKHADKQYHKDAVLRSDQFLKVMTHQQHDVLSVVKVWVRY